MKRRFPQVLLATISCLAVPVLALTLPQFVLPKGETVTIYSENEIKQKLRKDKDTQMTTLDTNVWLRQVIHLDEAKRISKNDEWAMLYYMHRKTDKNERSGATMIDADNKGLMVRFYKDADKAILSSLDGETVGQFSEEQQKTVNKIANREYLYHSMVNLAASKSWVQGEQIDLPPDVAETKFKAESATMTFKSVRFMWEKELAEFEVTTKFKDKGHCKVWYWALVESGAPVFVSMACKDQVTKDAVAGYHFSYLSQGFSYSHQPISQLAPSPIISQQPKGEVIDLVFSYATNQLAFLTKDYDTSTNWLSFWDIDQRKILFTKRQAGDLLSLSDDQETLFVVGKSRIHQAWVKTQNKFNQFGKAFNMDLAAGRQIVDADVIGKYPITLNAGHEIEVWNLGYNKLVFQQRLEKSQPTHLASTPDGKLVTLDASGTLGIHQLTINSLCSKKGDTKSKKEDISTAFCEEINVQLVEAENTKQYDLTLGNNYKDEPVQLEYIQIHPTEPIVGYCSEHPSNCGLINYVSEEHWKLPSVSNININDTSDIFTDSGIYNLRAEPVQSAEATANFNNFWQSSYWPRSTISTKHGLIFNKLPRADYITDHEILVRNASDGVLLDKITRRSFPINSIGVIDDNNFVFTSPSFTQTKLNSLDMTRLVIEDTTLEIVIDKLAISPNRIVFAGSGVTFIINSNESIDNHVLDFQVNSMVLLEEYLIYAKDQSIFQYMFADRTTKLLYHFDSPVHEIQVFDTTGEALVARLNYGQFALPHLDKTLDLPYNGGFGSALTYDAASQSFFVSGLYGYSTAFNSAIEVIQRFSIEGIPLQEMQPEWGEVSMMLPALNGELWSGDKSGDITIRDINSGLITDRFSAHQGIVTDIKQINPHMIATASNDGSVKLWRTDMTSGRVSHPSLKNLFQAFIEPDMAKRWPKLIATIVVDQDGEYVVNLPDGYYSATPKALHQASFLNGDEILDYTQYDFWLNRPDLVLQRLGNPDDNAMSQWQKMVSYRQTRNPEKPAILPAFLNTLDFELKGPEKIAVGASVQLAYEIQANQSEKAKSLHLIVNQVPVYGVEGKTLTSAIGELEIALTPGINKLKVYLTDEYGTQSETQFLTYNRRSEAGKPDLYILAVGVSDYKIDRLDLDYASKDAQDIVQVFEQNTEFDQVMSMQLLDLDATKDAVIAAKTFLQQARAQDTVVVFFAGHGMLDTDNNYYFGTTDIDPEEPQGNGLSYAAMTNLLDGIPSRQKLMMMDTCYSGEVTESAQHLDLPNGVTTRGLTYATESEVNISLSMLQKTFVDLRSSTGAIVISAAGGREFAIETDDIQNGIFTASVKQAFTDKAADKNQDGVISISELRAYTYSEVLRLSNGAQKPTTREHNLDVDFTIY